MRILAPVVRIVLMTFALLMPLTAIFIELVSTRPFPFFAVLASAIGAYTLLAVYETLLTVLSGRTRGRGRTHSQRF